MDSRLEQNFLLIGRLFFYAFAGRDRGDGGRGIIPGRRAAQVGCAGLQVVTLLFQAAKVIGQGSRGSGAVARYEGNDRGDALIDLDHLLIDGAGLGGVILVGGIGEAVRDGAGSGYFHFGKSHVFQDGEHGVLQALQTGRTGAFRAAGVITLYRSITILSAIIDGHQGTADGTVDETGKRIDLAGVINGGGALGLGAEIADALPFVRREERRHASGHADGFR